MGTWVPDECAFKPKPSIKTFAEMERQKKRRKPTPSVVNRWAAECQTENGTMVRLCPLTKTRHKPLYCSAEAEFFSFVRVKDTATGEYKRVLRQVKPWRTTHAPTRNSGGWQNYPKVGGGGQSCHVIMAMTWLGPKPGAEYEVDHLNGVTTDNRASNLQWVTRKENGRRARILRQLRAEGIKPHSMSREELLNIFEQANVE